MESAMDSAAQPDSHSKSMSATRLNSPAWARFQEYPESFELSYLREKQGRGFPGTVEPDSRI